MMGRILEKYIFVFYRGAKRQKCNLGELWIADLMRPRGVQMDLDGNSKLQITNNKQITMTEIRNSKALNHLKKDNSKAFLVIGI